MRQSMDEYSRMYEKNAQDSGEHNELQRQRVQKHRSDIDACLEAQAARLKLVEERAEVLEARSTETQQRHNEAIERMAQRHEKVAGHLEHVKLQGGQHLSNIDNLSKKLQELENNVVENDRHVRESSGLERKHRQQEIQSVRDAIKSEQERLHTVMDSKIAHHVNNESNSRQEMGQNIMEMVHSVVSQKGPKPFPDGTESIVSVRSRQPGGSMTIPTTTVAVPSLPLAAHSGVGSIALSGRGGLSPVRAGSMSSGPSPTHGQPPQVITMPGPAGAGSVTITVPQGQRPGAYQAIPHVSSPVYRR